MKKAIVVLVLLAFLISPFSATAQATDLKQLVELFIALGIISPDKADQARNAVSNSTSSTTSSSFCYSFTRNLGVGDRGNDVDALVKALVKEGMLPNTGENIFGEDFNETVAEAVISFQSKYGIRKTGYVGPITRAKLNSLYGCNTSIPTTPTIPQPTQPSTPVTPIVCSADVFQCPNGSFVNRDAGANCSFKPCPVVPVTPTATVSGSLLTSSTDRAGSWNNFNTGAGNGNQNPADWNFSANLNLPNTKTIKSVTLNHKTSGEVWSTSLSSDNTWQKTGYPLVVDYNGSQINVGYDNFLTSTFNAGTHNFSLFAQKEATVFTGGKLVFRFTDGTSAIADVPASNYQQPPTISLINPNQGSANTTATIYGTNLSGATTVQFYNSSGQNVASLASPSVTSVNSTSLVFTIGGAFAYNVEPGTYQVKVVTPAGTTNSQSFTLIAPTASTPTISNINPSQGGQNDTITIYGTNLSSASDVKFYQNGQFSASLKPAYTSSQNLNFTIGGVFAANVSAGAYQIRVLTPSGESNAVNFTLSTQSATLPTISSINPSQGSANTTATIYGTNLSGASSVQFYNSAGQNVAGISSPSISSINSSSLTFTIGGVFAANVESGTYQVKVVTPSGTSNSLPFTITTPVALPTVTFSYAGYTATNPRTEPIISGSSATVTWSSTGATSCEAISTTAVAFPTWTGTKALSGSENFVLPSNLVSGPVTVGIRCTNSAGSTESRVPFTVAPIPTAITLTVNGQFTTPQVTAGQPMTIAWTSTGTVLCQANTNPSSASFPTLWFGEKATSGSESIVIPADKRGLAAIGIQCRNATTWQSRDIFIDVVAPVAQGANVYGAFQRWPWQQ